MKIVFKKDYSKNYNIKFNGKIKVKIIYDENMKLKEVNIISKSKVFPPNNYNHIGMIKSFKEAFKIETDDVITLIDMFISNEVSKEIIGKGIFDK